MTKHKALLLVALAGMLFIAVGNAYGYKEWWSGAFAGGSLYRNNREYTFRAQGSSGGMMDVTAGSRDTFPDDSCSWKAVFVNDTIDDTLYLESWSGTHQGYTYYGWVGGKNTGTSGTKEGNGKFCGKCTNKYFYIYGTWDTGTNNDSKYFDYNQTPPKGNGDWDVSGSWGADVDGYGTWGITRSGYQD